MTSDDLLAVLACPRCRSQLVIESAPARSIRCEICALEFTQTASGYDFKAAGLPPRLETSLPIWSKLQANGLMSYQLAPELNLATRERRDVTAFREFMSLEGYVLDVGCGPQPAVPGYIDSTQSIDYVGLDPLPGDRKREFVHISGYAEMLPFADKVFGSVIFATSLDHLLDIRLALAEAARVLRPEGTVYIWTDDLNEAQDMSSWTRRALRIAIRGTEQALTGVRRMGMRRTFHYLRRAIDMQVPAGAVDYFHVALPTVGEVIACLANAGLKVTGKQTYQRSLFLRACVE